MVTGIYNLFTQRFVSMAIDGSDIKGSNPGSQQAAQSKGVLI